MEEHEKASEAKKLASEIDKINEHIKGLYVTGKVIDRARADLDAEIIACREKKQMLKERYKDIKRSSGDLLAASKIDRK